MSTRMILKRGDTLLASECPHDDMTAEEVVENLVLPVMLAVGYHSDSIFDALMQVGHKYDGEDK